MKKKLKASHSRVEKVLVAPVIPIDFHENFRDQLKAVFNGGRNLNNALPNLSAASSHDELKAAYQKHLQETKNQVKRLLHVFELLGKKVVAKKHASQEGLHGNVGASDIYQTLTEKEIAIAACNQQAESFDLASYGSLKAVAGIADMKQCHGM